LGAVTFELDEVWSIYDDLTIKKLFEKGEEERLVSLKVLDMSSIQEDDENSRQIF
jgi:hypothetical protein